MRIRKHAKFSPLLHTTPSPNPRAILHTPVCLLNRSPWDTMDFSPPPTPPPPPPHQGDGDGVSDGNVSSGRRISVLDRGEDHQPEYHQPPPENETKAAPAALNGKRWKKSYSTSSHPRKPKKASNKTSSNPNEFYYYSGFGPQWAKKRGDNNNSNRNNSIVNELEFEEYDEEEWNRANSGKKRGRKPIKARSLKSLM